MAMDNVAINGTSDFGFMFLRNCFCKLLNFIFRKSDFLSEPMVVPVHTVLAADRPNLTRHSSENIILAFAGMTRRISADFLISMHTHPIT